jgi:hypothetical protein
MSVKVLLSIIKLLLVSLILSRLTADFDPRLPLATPRFDPREASI